MEDTSVSIQKEKQDPWLVFWGHVLVTCPQKAGRITTKFQLDRRNFSRSWIMEHVDSSIRVRMYDIRLET